ncbi:MAG: DNA-processing protein DprA [Chromatiales bacterium]|jgi:DNA processing protein|nr:DNA-processing protein DprA [Chromatiales bacterium]
MDDIKYWLALQRIPGLGPVACRALLNRHPDPRQWFSAGGIAPDLIKALPKGALTALRTPNWRAIEADLRWLEKPGHHALTLHDPRYPPLLKEIHDAPLVLYVRGNPVSLSSLQLAIVGSRNPSPSGLDNARDFASALTQHGLTVTSGLAIGIDGAAHHGALAAGGTTIAVAATGLDIVYPARHRDLAEEIFAAGALVSEFAPGRPPLPEAFPRRNRIISGLSLGTLVVEAALSSGSLITARAALEQGREVFAIPGSIHDPRARGCHALLRQGAKLVECTQDILEDLDAIAQAARALTPPSTPPPSTLDATAAGVLAQIDFTPSTIDMLVERTGQAPEFLLHILLDLELANYITSAPAGAYVRQRPET